MAVTVNLDKISSLSAQEQFGLVTRLRRMALVKGLDANDFRILDKALAASGLPLPGSSPVDHPNLVLVQRNPSLVSGDKASVEIELVYELGPSDGFDLDNTDRPFIGKMTTNISQVETNLDVLTNIIKTKYTYPSDDPATKYAGKTRFQGGEIGVFRAEKTWTGRCIKAENNPGDLQFQMLLNVNEQLANIESNPSGLFLGEEERKWLCTAANYTPFEIFKEGDPEFKPRWMWDFEFQFNPDGWDPGVAFIHEETGVIPADLIEGEDEGFFNVVSYFSVDFEAILKTRILY